MRENVAFSKSNSILVVDDDEIFCARLVAALEARSYRVFSASNYKEALKVGHVEQPDYAIMDLRLPQKTGLDLLEEFLQISQRTKIVMLTGYGSIATALSAVRLGAVSYLTKPANADEILRALSSSENQIEQELTTPVPAVPSLARTEWEHIQRILSDCNGNISRAAKSLGIPRRSLQRKLAKFPPKL